MLEPGNELGDAYKGIKCPNPDCGTVGKYSGGQGTKGQDWWKRLKTCKVCGTTFYTIEVPVGVVTIKNDHLNMAVPPEVAPPIVPPVGPHLAPPIVAPPQIPIVSP